MADTSQVEAAIVALLGTVLYPNGTSSPSAITAPANVERGWPTEADVRAYTSQNSVLIRVHAVQGLSRDHTRYPRFWVDAPSGTPGITATIGNTTQIYVVDAEGNPILNAAGDPIPLGSPVLGVYTITLAGTPAAGQFVGANVEAVGYAYAVAADDTLDSIASNIAALIPNASATGAVIALPQSLVLVPHAVVELGGDSSVEAAREVQMFTVAVWAPSPALRDATLQLIHPALVYQYRLVLADGSIATLMDIQATGPDDEPSRAKEWRRDLRLNYDFPVTYTQDFPPVTEGVLALTPQPADQTLDYYT